jgi:MFS family permease
MATTGVPGDLVATSASKAPPQRSTWGLIQLSLFWIATNFHWAAIPLIILPSQVQVLLFQNHPAGLSGTALANYVHDAAPGTLALVVGPGLLTALIANPLFGYISDRTRLAWGRRKPYIIGGTLANLVGIAIMAFAPSIPVLIVGLIVTQLANNAAAAPFHALLPDLVSEAQRGKASGFMGLGQMLGTILGATLPGIVFGVNAQQVINGTQTVGQYQGTLVLAYGFTAAFILVLAVLTIIFVQERPLSERSDNPTADGIGQGNNLVRDVSVTILAIGVAIGATIGVMLLLGVKLDSEVAQNVLILPAVAVGFIGVAKAFDFRPRQHGDFTWVLITRGFVTMGIYTVLSFLQLYLQFVTFHGVANAPKPEDAAGIFIDIVIVMAALSTPFAGALSDRFGRKRMVYVSGAFMVIVGIIFLATPFLVPSLGVQLTFISAAIYGLGYGAYVSVDWALVTDVLPNEDNYARDMGIWNVALTAPQVLSYVIGAFVITAFTTGGIFAISGQPALGYTLLFVLFIIYATAGTITVRYIRGVKR